MFRLIFPEVSFSGRLSRAAFWRELMLSAMTTPIVLGLLAYLVNEFSVAAAHGLRVDDAAAKYLAGTVLSLIGLRNMLAFAGVIKRRLNDVGSRTTGLAGSAMWMMVAAGGSIFMLSQLGMRSGALLVIVLYLFFLWQLKALVVGGFKLLFSASAEAPGLNSQFVDAAPSWRQIERPLTQLGAQSGPKSGGRPSFQPLLVEFVRNARTEMEGFLGNMSKANNAKDMLAEMMTAARKVPVLSKLEDFQRWLNEPVVGKSSIVTADRDAAKIKSRNRTEDERGANRHREQRAVRAEVKKQPYVPSPSKAVRASHRLPKHGRSSFLAGLLRGPWG